MVRAIKLLESQIYRAAECVTKKKILKRRYCGQEFIGIDECNQIIYDAIRKKEPFMAGRFGGYELGAAVKFEYKNDKLIPDSKRRNAAHYLCMNAGFFPESFDMAYCFSQLMKDVTKEADLLAVWFNPMEDYWIGKYRSRDKFPTMVNTLRGLEPWYSSKPWTFALEEKNVLVIHPFADTIQKQFKNREKIFPDIQYLPDFRLQVLKAVQSIGGGNDRYSNWFEALNDMFVKAMNLNFDVAIIGCGAYGFPLAAKLKRAGKTVVHMGGATQLLFGIMGERWAANKRINELHNEFWVRPDEKERPPKAGMVEGGCYW